jgi:hypothetical protein
VPQVRPVADGGQRTQVLTGRLDRYSASFVLLAVIAKTRVEPSRTSNQKPKRSLAPYCLIPRTLNSFRSSTAESMSSCSGRPRNRQFENSRVRQTRATILNYWLK